MSRFFSKIFSEFLPLLALIYLAFVHISLASDASIYLVEEVAAESSGRSPSAARTAAVTSARRDAFLILLGRLDLNINTADNITDEEIFEMVRSEQIENEKIAGNRYSAMLKIMFAKDFVDHILEKKENSAKLFSTIKHDENVEEIDVIIPVKIVNKKPIMWDNAEVADWSKAIGSHIVKSSKKKLELANSYDQKLNVVGAENFQDATYDSLSSILQNHSAAAAYILSFSHDNAENKVSVEISYIRKMQKKQSKLTFINTYILSSEELLNKVAKKTIDYISQAPTVENSDNIAVNFVIPITTLSEWLATKRRLENSNLVNQINLKSLARDRVIISATYLNNTVDIVESFARLGINLEKQSAPNGDNFYIFKR